MFLKDTAGAGGREGSHLKNLDYLEMRVRWGRTWGQPQELFSGGKGAQSFKKGNWTVGAYPGSVSLLWMFTLDPVISALFKHVSCTLL